MAEKKIDKIMTEEKFKNSKSGKLHFRICSDNPISYEIIDENGKTLKKGKSGEGNLNKLLKELED